MSNNKDLYFKVLKLLKEKNLTQTQLAEKIGITQSSLSKILSGKYSTKITTAQKLAKVLNVSADYFINSDEKNSKKENIEDKNYLNLTSKMELLEEKMKRYEAENALLRKELELIKNELGKNKKILKLQKQ